MSEKEKGNSKKCCYCGCNDPKGIVMCNICKKWFCNCLSMKEGSHAFLHLSIAHHNSVRTHKSSPFHGKSLCCSTCGSTNVFDLRYNTHEMKAGVPVLLCLSKCIAKKSQKDRHYADNSWYPIVDDRRFVSYILSSPRVGEQAPTNLCIELIRQYEVLCVTYPNMLLKDVQLEQAKQLEKAKLDYEDTLEYYNVFEPLLRIEQSESHRNQLMDGDKHSLVHFMRNDKTQKVVASFHIHMCEYCRVIREWDRMLITYCMYQDDFEGIDSTEYEKHMNNVNTNRRKARGGDEGDGAAEYLDEMNELDQASPGVYANMVNTARIEYSGYISSLREVDASISLYSVVLTIESRVIPTGMHAFRDGFFDIRLKDAASTIERRIHAISMMDEESSMHQTIFDIILGNKEVMNKHDFSLSKEDKEATYNAPHLRPLNESQRKALVECLQSRFTLVQGPPGTGKTSVLRVHDSFLDTAATIVYQLVQRTHAHIVDVPKGKRGDAKAKLKTPGRILVCTPSNVAADEICRRIHMTGVNVVRLMALSKEEMVSPVEELCVHAQALRLLSDESKDVRSHRRVAMRGVNDA